MRFTLEAFIIFQGWSLTLHVQNFNFGEFPYLSGIYSHQQILFYNIHIYQYNRMYIIEYMIYIIEIYNYITVYIYLYISIMYNMYFSHM